MIISQIAPNTIQQIDPIFRALSSLSASSLSSLVAKNDELVRSDLEAFRTIFFICLVAATIAVFAGVALEEGEAWMHAIDHVLPLDPITVYRWAKTLVKVGWILIVIGVAGEGVFEVYLTRADGILSTFDNILLTEARKEASDAVLGAATANIQVAEARQRTAELEREAAGLREQTEAERLARVKIEAAVAFRSLDDNQKRDIGTALAHFGSIAGASMWFVNGSTESELFADDIAEALRSAHIHTTTVGGIMEMAEGGGHWDEPIKPSNTGVEIASTSNPVAHDLADVLLKELTSRGFDATRRPDQKSERNPPGLVIWVTVLARPKGPQGEFKLQAEREAKAKNSTTSK